NGNDSISRPPSKSVAIVLEIPDATEVARAPTTDLGAASTAGRAAAIRAGVGASATGTAAAGSGAIASAGADSGTIEGALSVEERFRAGGSDEGLSEGTPPNPAGARPRPETSTGAAALTWAWTGTAPNARRGERTTASSLVARGPNAPGASLPLKA